MKNHGANQNDGKANLRQWRQPRHGLRPPGQYQRDPANTTKTPISFLALLENGISANSSRIFSGGKIIVKP